MVLMQSRFQEVLPPGQVGSILIPVRHWPSYSALSHADRHPNGNTCAVLIRLIVGKFCYFFGCLARWIRDNSLRWVVASCSPVDLDVFSFENLLAELDTLHHSPADVVSTTACT
jgi:hypothetical protein